MSHPDFPGGSHVIDFEFHPAAGKEGNLAVPVCLVDHNIDTGVTTHYWGDALSQMRSAPFSTDASSLIVAYNASAEMACFKVLDWASPANILDLYAEFRNLTNGLWLPAGKGLLGALVFFGEAAIAVAAKEAMRDLILSGGPWSASERAAILAYCASDVMALTRLLARMDRAGAIDWSRALLRGQYAIAAAASEVVGIPIDHELYGLLCAQSQSLRTHLIAQVDASFGVFEGGHFRAALFEAFLRRQGIAWPRRAS